MRKSILPELEKYRRRDLELEFAGVYAEGMDGFFQTDGIPGRLPLRIMSGNDNKWEHVSVSTQIRTPNWNEMCLVKDFFWLPEETVLQFHPPQSKYVNCHPYTLHLWRPTFIKIPVPDMWRV